MIFSTLIYKLTSFLCVLCEKSSPSVDQRGKMSENLKYICYKETDIVIFQQYSIIHQETAILIWGYPCLGEEKKTFCIIFPWATIIAGPSFGWRLEACGGAPAHCLQE